MNEEVKKSLLSKENIATLESFQDGVSGYFEKMIDYLDDFVADGVREGKFTEKEAQEDLDIALWYAYAFNNTDIYENYYKTIKWMPYSEKNAKGCGVWFYRYCVALMYCGKLEKALSYAKKAVKEEPTYPWGWLQLAKLLAHFKDTEGAFAAIEKGLELVPNDYEFTILKCEIIEGYNIEKMANHYIDAVSDKDYQSGKIDDKEKITSIAGILCNKRALNRIKKLFQVENWQADSPYCKFNFTIDGKKLDGLFRMNEAAVSKIDFKWLKEQKKDITELYLQYESDDESYELNEVAFNRDRSIDLIYYDERQEKYFTLPIGRYDDDDEEEPQRFRLYLQSWKGEEKVIQYVECWVDDDGITKHKGFVGDIGMFEHYPCEHPIDYDKFLIVFEAGYDYLGYKRWNEYDYIHIAVQIPIKNKYVEIIDETTMVFSKSGKVWYDTFSNSLLNELNGKGIGDLSGMFIKKDNKRNFILSVYAQVVVEDLAVKTIKDVLFNGKFKDVDLNHLNIGVMRILEDDYELVYSADNKTEFSS